MKKTRLTVIDFFSGAGGFSEGFRQQGFKIVKGIDNWEPAVLTHNLNHGLNDLPDNVLNYVGTDSSDVEHIERLPDVDVIIGSPSCVTFSMSNKGGKADKTEGLKLIEAYLRVIAVKKHKKNSTLKVWLMENVPNSGNYVKHDYSFSDLNLDLWAKANAINPNTIALSLNGVVLNASDYGAPQNRNRFICGEYIKNGRFPMPKPVKHSPLRLKDIKSKMPKPNDNNPSGIWEDPNYPVLKLEADHISDHFYDTGLYITQWEQAKYLKTMHPFMGKMSFPEDEEKKSRTITATRSSSTREALIYKSEYIRIGHGEYRAPTIREVASLMGYPYTYQFFGSESLKWKLIGNSVSPQLSSALAKAILKEEGHRHVPANDIDFDSQKNNYLLINNLNNYTPNSFDENKLRRIGARFRRSLYKAQNMTVDLLNYYPGESIDIGKKWYVSVFYGTGSEHQYDVLTKASYRKLSDLLSKEFDLFDDFILELESYMGGKSLTPRALQKAYETDSELTNELNPLVLIEKLSQIAKKYASTNTELRLTSSGLSRQEYSLSLLLCLFSAAYIVYNETQTVPVGEKSFAYEF
ncbi:MAG TPA: DNA cytosine methyltransferase [Candidatus Saccharimonadales bacterium]|nr:DNA cytosine methyltransferase [Candidatus Saccharimonadales bacterium]